MQRTYMSWRIIVDYHKLNLVDKVTCPVDMSESLSSATSIHRQYGLTNKAAMVTPMEVTHGVSNGLHAWSPIWLLPLQSAEFANSLLNNDLASFSRGIIQLPGGSLFTLEHIHHGRSRYILNGIETLSECRFAFPTCNISAKTNTHWLVNALLTIIIFYTA